MAGRSDRTNVTARDASFRSSSAGLYPKSIQIASETLGLVREEVV
jgi:hypothetical protein